MDRINDIKDDVIRHLASTLKSSGLAASESEAIRMATNMSNTNNKVNKSFEDKKEESVMGLSFLHKDYNKKPVESVQPEYVEEEYREPGFVVKQTKEVEHDCSSCAGCESVVETDEVFLDTSLDEDAKLNDLFEVESENEVVQQDVLDDEPEVFKEIKQTQESQTSERVIPKKNLDLYEEAKVDLGAVFKFKN